MASKSPFSVSKVCYTASKIDIVVSKLLEIASTRKTDEKIRKLVDCERGFKYNNNVVDITELCFII